MITITIKGLPVELTDDEAESIYKNLDEYFHISTRIVRDFIVYREKLNAHGTEIDHTPQMPKKNTPPMPMSYRLKTYNDVPPGNYWYEQTEGVQKKFDSSPVIFDTAWKVLALRKGNNLARATIQEALEDVDNFTVARLIAEHGVNNEWIYDTERSFSALHPAASIRSCSSCGAKVE